MNPTTSPPLDRTTFDVARSGCLDACRRCATVLDHTGSGDVYAAVGPHLRHCLEHFTSLLRGVKDGLVDYDARERDNSLETDPDCFRRGLAQAMDGLQRLDNPGQELRVRQAAAVDAEPVELASNLERELVFLSGHTIHHLAIIDRIASGLGVALPESLSVAYSTAAFRKQSQS